MNATLQCLLHIYELIAYFLNEYPNDLQVLLQKNKDIESKGKISNAFYDLVKGVYNIGESENAINPLKGKTSIGKKFKNLFNFGQTSNAFSPNEFKKVIGLYNPQFRSFDANDSKDLILYLLQSMHEELNYYGDKAYINIGQPNQLDRFMTFTFFNQTYNWRNFSIISQIFYGTYENITKCKECNNFIYNFQKFEFISFGLYGYHRKKFNIYDGFKDNEKPQLLYGDNQFYCNVCKKLCDAVITSKILQPPNKLLINLDYGKNKKYQPNLIEFDQTIDITKYVNLDFEVPIKYNIIGVCTHLGYSGSFGHYIAFCKNKQTEEWYNFSDSSCIKCKASDISKGSPYLLLYEKI